MKSTKMIPVPQYSFFVRICLAWVLDKAIGSAVGHVVRLMSWPGSICIATEEPEAVATEFSVTVPLVYDERVNDALIDDGANRCFNRRRNNQYFLSARIQDFLSARIRPLDPRFFEREGQYPPARRTCCGTSSRSSASGFHVAGAGTGSTAGASAPVVILREKQTDSEPQSGSAAAAQPLLPPGEYCDRRARTIPSSIRTTYSAVVVLIDDGIALCISICCAFWKKSSLKIHCHGCILH